MLPQNSPDFPGTPQIQHADSPVMANTTAGIQRFCLYVEKTLACVGLGYGGESCTYSTIDPHSYPSCTLCVLEKFPLEGDPLDPGNMGIWFSGNMGNWHPVCAHACLCVYLHRTAHFFLYECCPHLMNYIFGYYLNY